MRLISSGLLKIAVLLWAATLAAILLFHRLTPADAWITMLSRPVFLVIAPLFVACIPIVAAKPSELRRADAYAGAESSDAPRSKLRTVLLVWMASVALFASPHGATAMASLDFIWHNPLFLLIAPVLLACVSLLLPRGWKPEIRPIKPSSSFQVWKGLIAGIFMAIILALCLIGVNSMKNAVGLLQVNIAILVLLAGDLAILWSAIRKLRHR